MQSSMTKCCSIERLETLIIYPSDSGKAGHWHLLREGADKAVDMSDSYFVSAAT